VTPFISTYFSQAAMTSESSAISGGRANTVSQPIIVAAMMAL
jgi:hypothetical protein